MPAIKSFANPALAFKEPVMTNTHPLDGRLICVTDRRSRRTFVPSLRIRSAGIFFSALAYLCAASDAMASATRSSSTGNLLTNPSFESQLTGWTVLSSNPSVVSYGTTDVPGVAVSNIIGGGNRLLRDGSNARVEQVVNTGPLPAGTLVYAGGYFGGAGAAEDSTSLVLRFLDGTAGEIAVRNLPAVSRNNRNCETVVMLRGQIFEVPAGTESIAVRIAFADVCCGGSFATVDALCLELDPSMSAPLPLDTELLVNGEFEGGWASNSPLTLVGPRGWEGIENGSGECVLVKPYSNSDGSVPSLVVSNIISGGVSLLAHAGGNGTLRQRLDLRANANQIAQGLDLRLAAYLGGGGTTTDRARLQAWFRDNSGNLINPPVDPIGPVTREDRNAQTLVLRREAKFLIPQQAAYVDIDVLFADDCCGGPFGLVDRVSAMLMLPSPVEPLPLATNLIQNASFEAGSLPGSPLQLNASDGWFGCNTATEVLAYGSTGEVPTVGFANSRGLGGLLLNDFGGNGRLCQRLSLHGYEQQIQQGLLRVDASVWLGGYSTDQDTAELRFQFLNESGVQVGGLNILGPVTAADRGNQTILLFRAGSFFVPLGAVSLLIDARFSDVCCGGTRALMDNVCVELRVHDLGTAYCTATNNSTGAAAIIQADGSTSVSANNLFLRAGPVPDQPGLFYYGPNQAQVSFGNGFRCVGGGTLGRLKVVHASCGTLSFALDNTNPPNPQTQITAGSTWNFQAWFRDPSAGGSAFNLSDGRRLMFVP